MAKCNQSQIHLEWEDILIKGVNTTKNEAIHDVATVTESVPRR